MAYAYLPGATLTGANLTSANLAFAHLTGATLTGANLAGADLRRSARDCYSNSSNTTTNTILTDGTIEGLSLDANNPTLLVRNYSDVPIQVLQKMSLSPGASLVLQFDDNPWGSTICFDAGIPVALDGTLELDYVGEDGAASLLGDSFQVFDWTGVSPLGAFASISSNLPAGYSWDTSQLYTTGDVTLVAIPEPSSLALLGAGATLLLGYAWRRQRKGRQSLSIAAGPNDSGQDNGPAILSLPSRWTPAAHKAA